MMFANDYFDINAEVIFISHNLEYASAWLLCRSWPIGDFNIDDNAVEIAPIAATGGFVTENAVFGSRASSVVDRAQFFSLRRVTHDTRRFIRIFHFIGDYYLL